MDAAPHSVPYRRIGTILVDRQLITGRQLEQALAEQQQTGRPLGEICVDRYGLDRLSLADALAEQWEEMQRAAPAEHEGDVTPGQEDDPGESAAEDVSAEDELRVLLGEAQAARLELKWDLPALDSYEMNRAIYRIPDPDFRRARDEMVELLEIGDLVRKPVRTLSLGERMKAEICGALLHRPQVLFLDEPTIGLDVTMQKRIRAFLADYNTRHGATILLTSHYMADVQALCRRVVLVDAGTIRYDGSLRALSERYSPQRRSPPPSARWTRPRWTRPRTATWSPPRTAGSPSGSARTARPRSPGCCCASTG